MDQRLEITNLLQAVAAGRISEANLDLVLWHVAEVGFALHTRERVCGRLTGTVWEGRTLKGSDMLPPAEVHYLWHVVRRREWPEGTSLAEYIESLRTVVLDATSGIVLGHYQGALQLGVVRESRELRGPDGHAWVVVQYRVGYGHWVTGYQPEAGLDEFAKPQWSDVLWLRQPRPSGGR